ncbi:MOSC domain-containing protein [Haloglomus halophilum]|uniref:MOSC domain-containing protein n=1 Tax=Haloglomus halophilum TaxID=2962672 RepID=UPI0020C96430|nr:MOSC domain-containing protein [Haloglomus halophilum]
MTSDGIVRAIHVAPESGAPVESRDAVMAAADAGLRGDRYFDETGTFASREGSDLTLIEREALDAVEADYDIALEPGIHRRNVTTEGIALNHLVGERFRVGDAVCVGVELCEPCSYLERHLEREGVREALVHRGGLRARIVTGGTVAVGDAVTGLTAGDGGPDGPEN